MCSGAAACSARSRSSSPGDRQVSPLYLAPWAAQESRPALSQYIGAGAAGGVALRSFRVLSAEEGLPIGLMSSAYKPPKASTTNRLQLDVAN